MGNSLSSPSPNMKTHDHSCYEGRLMPSQGQVCHAPRGADLANTLLSVSLDHRDLKCHPSYGGNYTVRVEYAGRDGRTHKTERQNQLMDGPGWEGSAGLRLRRPLHPNQALFDRHRVRESRV
ncbi:hypothetical protein PG988_001963 [Apiospora saccharicola]